MNFPKNPLYYIFSRVSFSRHVAVGAALIETPGMPADNNRGIVHLRVRTVMNSRRIQRFGYCLPSCGMYCTKLVSRCFGTPCARSEGS